MESMRENEIIIYQPDETLALDVRVEEDTVWLNRNQIEELFGRDVKTIGKHVANALKETLAGIPAVKKFATTATDGEISQQLIQDVERHNAQYPGVTLHAYNKAHNRFLIIDEEVYHIGHPLKDLGKKLFAFLKNGCYDRFGTVIRSMSE